MPSYVYSHRPGFLYSAITQFDFMNLNIQTANVTLLDKQVILPSGSQSSGTCCSVRMELGPGFTFQCISTF